MSDKDELTYGYIKVSLNYAPKTNGKRFPRWCKDSGFTPLNGGRRAWSSSLSTYLRGADGLAYADGEPFLFYEEDLVDIEAIKNRAVQAFGERLLAGLPEEVPISKPIDPDSVEYRLAHLHNSVLMEFRTAIQEAMQSTSPDRNAEHGGQR